MRAYFATGNENSRVEMKDVSALVAVAGSAIVKVEAISLNRGELSGLATAGARPGWDFAGTVTEADPAGAGPSVGMRVAGVINGGAWAEQVTVPVGQIGPLPSSVTTEQGSTLGIAGLTALRAIRAAGVTSGKRILVTGASGAVGRFAVQLASLYSGKVTALVSRVEQAQAVRAIGAGTVFVQGEQLPGPYDIIIDGVAGPALEAAVRAAGPNAKIITYGIASGKPAQLKFADFRNGPGSTLQGFFIWQSDLATFGSDLSYLAKLVSAGTLDAHIAKEFGWEDLNAALAVLVERTAVGKIVVRVP